MKENTMQARRWMFHAKDSALYFPVLYVLSFPGGSQEQDIEKVQPRAEESDTASEPVTLGEAAPTAGSMRRSTSTTACAGSGNKKYFSL